MQDRVKSFDNVRNFRDFGGYEGVDGRKVKPGILYRSAQFGEASEADLARLETFGIAVQADLRRPDERERHGHRWPVKDVQVISSDKGRAQEAPHVRFLTEVAVDADQAHAWMCDYYRQAPYKPQHVDTFSAWFEALEGLGEGEAVVVNCAAGKDRTGILCALTHHMLGVQREMIFLDYELTNEAANVAERLPVMAQQFNAYIGKSHDEAVYHPFVGVDGTFLKAAFASIEAKSGSLDTYLTETLGLSSSRKDAIKSRLLES